MSYEARVREANGTHEKLALIAEGIDAILARRKKTAEETEADLKVSAEVEAVFKHWQTKMKRPRAGMTKERRRAIQSRLTDGYTVDRIKRAIDGCANSDFHMARGEYTGRHTYCDLTLICRNGTKLEEFEAMPAGGSGNGKAFL